VSKVVVPNKARYLRRPPANHVNSAKGVTGCVSPYQYVADSFDVMARRQTACKGHVTSAFFFSIYEPDLVTIIFVNIFIAYC
jgi:hypothetical protein